MTKLSLSHVLLFPLALAACAGSEGTDSPPAAAGGSKAEAGPTEAAAGGAAGAAGKGGASADSGAGAAGKDAASEGGPLDGAAGSQKDASEDSLPDVADASTETDTAPVPDSAEACSNACVETTKQCVGNSVQTCVAGSAGCTLWSTPIPCNANETCSQGTCSASCTNDCKQGETTCDGVAVKTCEKSGTCWKWGPSAACTAPQVCSNGVCVDPGPLHKHLEIYIDNFCNVSIVPESYDVAAGDTLQVTYHNNSVDYNADIWSSYGGGYLGLVTGGIWDDPFEYCSMPSVYTAAVDINIEGGPFSSCPGKRLYIYCK